MQNLCRDLIYFCFFKMIIDGKNSVNLKHSRDFQNFWVSKFLKKSLKIFKYDRSFPINNIYKNIHFTLQKYTGLSLMKKLINYTSNFQNVP